MLRVTIELLPLGDESKAEVLHQAIIYNTGDGTVTKGKYHALFAKKHKLFKGPNWLKDTSMVYAHGYAKDFPRKRQNAWRLLHRILDGMYSKGNGPIA